MFSLFYPSPNIYHIASALTQPPVCVCASLRMSMCSLWKRWAKGQGGVAAGAGCHFALNRIWARCQKDYAEWPHNKSDIKFLYIIRWPLVRSFTRATRTHAHTHNISVCGSVLACERRRGGVRVLLGVVACGTGYNPRWKMLFHIQSAQLSWHLHTHTYIWYILHTCAYRKFFCVNSSACHCAATILPCALA